MVIEHGREWPYVWRWWRVRLLLAFMYPRHLGLWRIIRPHLQIVRCYSRIPYVVFSLFGIEISVYGRRALPPWPGPVGWE